MHNRQSIALFCAVTLIPAVPAFAQFSVSSIGTSPPARIGITVPGTIWFSNANVTPVEVTNLALSGPDSSAFTLSFSAPATFSPQNLAARSYEFTPTRSGRHSATLTVTCNDATTPVFTFELVRMGYGAINGVDAGKGYLTAGSGLYEVDLGTGNRVILNPENTSGPNVNAFGGMTEGLSGNILMGSDFGFFDAIAVNPVTLVRTQVSRSIAPNIVGTGPDFPGGVGDLRRAPDNRFYFLAPVAGQTTVGVMDYATGARSVLSGTDPSNSTVVGTGPTLAASTSTMAFTSTNSILVISLNSVAPLTLVSIDRSTGNRSAVDLTPPDLLFRSIDSLPNGNLVGAAYDNSLYVIAVPSGVATKVSGLVGEELLGEGLPFVVPSAVSVAPNGEVYVSDLGAGAFFRVDLNTGNRSVLSAWGQEVRGTGPAPAVTANVNSYNRTYARSLSNAVIMLDAADWRGYQ